MRFKGEKKISSVPYMLGVLTNAQKTSLRMGVQVPVPITTFGPKSEGGAAPVPLTSYTYRDVGTNIDCEAEDVGNGVFSLAIAVDDSTLFLDRSVESAEEQEDLARRPGLPLVPRQLRHPAARWTDDAVRVGDRSDQR